MLRHSAHQDKHQFTEFLREPMMPTHSSSSPYFHEPRSVSVIRSADFRSQRAQESSACVPTTCCQYRRLADPRGCRWVSISRRIAGADLDHAHDYGNLQVRALCSNAVDVVWAQVSVGGSANGGCLHLPGDSHSGRARRRASSV
jgi:hypothetical protein